MDAWMDGWIGRQIDINVGSRIYERSCSAFCLWHFVVVESGDAPTYQQRSKTAHEIAVAVEFHASYEPCA